MTITYLLDTNVVEPLVTEALRFGDTECRQPDFTDPVTGTAVWIGEDVTVEVPFEHLTRVAQLARDSACAHRRPAPEALGVRVLPHNPKFVHPAYSAGAYSPTLSAWAAFGQTVRAA